MKEGAGRKVEEDVVRVDEGDGEVFPAAGGVEGLWGS